MFKIIFLFVNLILNFLSNALIKFSLLFLEIILKIITYLNNLIKTYYSTSFKINLIKSKTDFYKAINPLRKDLLEKQNQDSYENSVAIGV